MKNSVLKGVVQPSDVEQLLNKMSGSWVYEFKDGKYIYRIKKTSSTTGHLFWEEYIGGGDSMEFDFCINEINSDGITTLYMDMDSLKKHGLSPNFTTIPVNTLMNKQNSIIFFKATFNRE